MINQDKYTAVWVSHSSISDFLACPRAYYLKNVYKDPKTNRKIQLVSAPLTLGSAVHEVIESLSSLPTTSRFREPLVPQLEAIWQQKYTGKQGGFLDSASEERYLNRAKDMLAKIVDDPGPLANLAVKINLELPYYWLSPEDNIILCGKIDWLEYLPDLDSVHIIDFKTGKKQEKKDSLQLPIYHLLVKNTQKRQVAKASYWYLSQNTGLIDQPLPDLEKSHQQVLSIAKKIKLARQLDRFKCPHGGCPVCQPYEAILKGEAEHVAVNDFGQDVYLLPQTPVNSEADSIIL